jgi:hypothetical protein
MTLTYKFGPNKEEYFYYVDEDMAYQYLVDNNYFEDDEEMELSDFEDELKDHYYEDAYNEYKDFKEEQKDPLKYRGMSPKDFY